MYFSLNKINKTFTVKHRSASSINNRGRATRQPGESTTLIGVLSKASEKDVEKHKQMNHNVTHTIIQEGAPIAEREDILTLDDRAFFVHDVKNPMGITSGLGSRTVYVVEERRDVNDQS